MKLILPFLNFFLLCTRLEAMAHKDLHTSLGTNWNWDGESITRANAFLYQLQSSPFLVGFRILVQVLLVLKELTVKLQSVDNDVTYAYSMVESVIRILKNMRKNSEKEFHKQFLEAMSLGKSLHGSEFELLVLLANNYTEVTTHPRVLKTITEFLSTMSFSHM